MNVHLRSFPFSDLFRYVREYSLLIRPAAKNVKGYAFIGIKKMMSNSFEPDLCKLIEKQFELGSRAFVDVGAHHGFFTIMAASMGMHVTAFEPDPINFKVLSRNIRINNFENVKAFNLGLGDKEEQLYFFGFSTGVSVEPRWAGNVSKRKFKVQVRKLDDIMDTIDSDVVSTIMKIDVEGFEENVINGAENFIKKSRNLLLIIEITFMENQSLDGGFRTQAMRLVQKLIGWNYLPMNISAEGKLIPIEQKTLDSLIGGNLNAISGNIAFRRGN